jgi:hypothetical protein
MADAAVMACHRRCASRLTLRIALATAIVCREQSYRRVGANPRGTVSGLCRSLCHCPPWSVGVYRGRIGQNAESYGLTVAHRGTVQSSQAEDRR